MAKMKKKIKRYCPYCKAHKEHTVERAKKRKASELTWGQRQFRRVTAGYGGYPRPLPSGAKMHTRSNGGYRARMFELVD